MLVPHRNRVLEGFPRSVNSLRAGFHHC